MLLFYMIFQIRQCSFLRITWTSGDFLKTSMACSIFISNVRGPKIIPNSTAPVLPMLEPPWNDGQKIFTVSSQKISKTVESLLDNTPNYLVGSVIQKENIQKVQFQGSSTVCCKIKNNIFGKFEPSIYLYIFEPFSLCIQQINK